MDLNDYRRCRYRDGGRGNGVFDCWGIVRSGLHHLFGYPLFASFGSVGATDKQGATASYNAIMGEFVTADRADEGVVMLAFHGQVLQHVGLCVKEDGRLKVMHAHIVSGVRFDSVANFPRFCDGNRVEMIKVAG